MSSTSHSLCTGNTHKLRLLGDFGYEYDGYLLEIVSHNGSHIKATTALNPPTLTYATRLIAKETRPVRRRAGAGSFISRHMTEGISHDTGFNPARD